MDFKVPEDLHTNRNGRIMNVSMDEKSIGMPDQKFNPYAPDSTNSGKLFPNGSDKSDGAGVINKNGEYGPITYGF